MSNYAKPMIAIALIAGLTILGVALILRDDGDEDMETVSVSAGPDATAVETGEIDDGDELVDPDATSGDPVDPDDVPISGSELRSVERAAIAVVGEGTVTDVDRSDDLGEAYEVEVVTDRGEVDVALDENLERVANQRYED